MRCRRPTTLSDADGDACTHAIGNMAHAEQVLTAAPALFAARKGDGDGLRLAGRVIDLPDCCGTSPIGKQASPSIWPCPTALPCSPNASAATCVCKGHAYDFSKIKPMGNDTFFTLQCPGPGQRVHVLPTLHPQTRQDSTVTSRRWAAGAASAVASTIL